MRRERRRATRVADMPERRPSPLNPSMIGPALIGFVIGFVVGIVLEGPVVGLALGVALAVSAVGRRWAAARMAENVEAEQRKGGGGGRRR
jgi:hypothetical protein